LYFLLTSKGEFMKKALSTQLDAQFEAFDILSFDIISDDTPLGLILSVIRKIKSTIFNINSTILTSAARLQYDKGSPLTDPDLISPSVFLSEAKVSKLVDSILSNAMKAIENSTKCEDKFKLD